MTGMWHVSVNYFNILILWRHEGCILQKIYRNLSCACHVISRKMHTAKDSLKLVTCLSHYFIPSVSTAVSIVWQLHLSVFLISSYDAPKAQRASYLALRSSLFGPDGAVNYDYIITNSINSLLIGSRYIRSTTTCNYSYVFLIKVT